MNQEAWERALRILEKRDVSRRMLTDKLTGKGISEEDAEKVAERLCELGVVDDARYAALVVRHYAAKGYGCRRICDELYRRGVAKELWDTALEELPAQDDDAYRQLSARLRGREVTPEAVKKATAALYRRGFSWDEIRSAVERCRSECED